MSDHAPKTVYRTTNPDALAAWHSGADARDAWADQMEAFLDEHGFGKRRVYIGHSGRVFGIESVDGEDLPDGWRIDSRTGYLMPRLAKKAGKQIDGRLAELIQPDPRNQMPGMPKHSFVSLAMLTCGLELIDGALNATWSRPIPDSVVDLAVWEQVKLSDYYRAVEERDEVAVSAP